MDKETIKKELVSETNDILIKYDENELIDSVSVMNMASKTVFLGSLKVYNEDNVDSIIKDLKIKLKNYGNISLRDEKVVPCCAAKFTHVSFNISVTN